MTAIYNDPYIDSVQEQLRRRQMEQAQQLRGGGGGPPPGAMQFMGGGGGGGGGGGLGAAGPWAALAAAIIANETYQKGSGNRPDSEREWAGDLASGKVLERDAQRYLGDGGETIAKFGTPHGTASLLRDGTKKLRKLFGG